MTAPFLPNVSNSTGASTSNGTIDTNTSGHNTSTTQQTGSGTGQTGQANVYNPWQQQEQQQAGQAASSFLQTGNLPGTLGAPPAETQAYINNFNQNVAPQLAAQYGAGSPAIASQEALGLSQLASSEQQQGESALSGAIGQEANIGFNAIGSAGNTQQAQNQTTNTSGNWQEIQDQANQMASAATNFGISLT